jgi:hypothetical protein
VNVVRKKLSPFLPRWAKSAGKALLRIS